MPVILAVIAATSGGMDGNSVRNVSRLADPRPDLSRSFAGLVQQLLHEGDGTEPAGILRDSTPRELEASQVARLGRFFVDQGRR